MTPQRKLLSDLYDRAKQNIKDTGATVRMMAYTEHNSVYTHVNMRRSQPCCYC